MHEGQESSEVIVARTSSIISLALLNDNIDDEWEDRLEWMTMKKRRQ